MRMLDILQFLKNVAANVTVKLGGSGGLPSVEVSGKDLLEIHKNSIWIAGVIADGFLEPRIMWEDVAHEFHFVPDDKLAFVCKEALSNAEAAVRRGRDQVPAHTSAEFAIVDLLIATEAILVGAKKSVIDREDYNRWVREIGGDSSETMTVGEHLASCLEIVQKVRKETYPMWSSLIDLLPDGMTKEQATQKLRSGCKSVGLDTGDVLPDWQVSANN